MHIGLFRCSTAPAQRTSRNDKPDDVRSNAQPFTSRLLSCLQSPVSGNQLTSQERLTPEKLCEAEEAPNNLSKYSLRGDTPLSRHLTRNNAQWRATVHSELKQQQAKLAKASKKDKKASLQESARLHEKELNALQSQVDQLGRDAEALETTHSSQLQQQQVTLAAQYEGNKQASLRESARLHEEELSALQSSVQSAQTEAEYLQSQLLQAQAQADQLHEAEAREHSLAVRLEEAETARPELHAEHRSKQQVMQAEADSATQIITELRAQLAAMTTNADAAQLQLTTLTSEASAMRQSADSAQADAQQLRQQLTTSQIQADSAAQTLVSLTAELTAMTDKADAAEELQAAAQARENTLAAKLKLTEEAHHSLVAEHASHRQELVALKTELHNSKIEKSAASDQDLQHAHPSVATQVDASLLPEVTRSQVKSVATNTNFNSLDPNMLQCSFDVEATKAVLPSTRSVTIEENQDAEPADNNILHFTQQELPAAAASCKSLQEVAVRVLSHNKQVVRQQQQGRGHHASACAEYRGLDLFRATGVRASPPNEYGSVGRSLGAYLVTPVSRGHRPIGYGNNPTSMSSGGRPESGETGFVTGGSLLNDAVVKQAQESRQADKLEDAEPAHQEVLVERDSAHQKLEQQSSFDLEKPEATVQADKSAEPEKHQDDQLAVNSLLHSVQQQLQAMTTKCDRLAVELAVRDKALAECHSRSTQLTEELVSYRSQTYEMDGTIAAFTEQQTTQNSWISRQNSQLAELLQQLRVQEATICALRKALDFSRATGERDGPHNEYGAAAIPQSSYPINPIYEGDGLNTPTECGSNASSMAPGGSQESSVTELLIGGSQWSSVVDQAQESRLADKLEEELAPLHTLLAERDSAHVELQQKLDASEQRATSLQHDLLESNKQVEDLSRRLYSQKAKLDVTEGQARAVKQLQSLLQESRQQVERLRAEMCRRRTQQAPPASGNQIQQATAQLQQRHQAELAALHCQLDAAERRAWEQGELPRSSNILLHRADAAHALTQNELDAHRQAEHSGATHLHTMQHEVKQAAAHAEGLSLPERSQFRKNMWNQWHPDKHKLLSKTAGEVRQALQSAGIFEPVSAPGSQAHASSTTPDRS